MQTHISKLLYACCSSFKLCSGKIYENGRREIIQLLREKSLRMNEEQTKNAFQRFVQCKSQQKKPRILKSLANTFSLSRPSNINFQLDINGCSGSGIYFHSSLTSRLDVLKILFAQHVCRLAAPQIQ